MENQLEVITEISNQIDTIAFNITKDCISDLGLKSELNLQVFLSNFFRDFGFYNYTFEFESGVVYIHKGNESICFEVQNKHNLFNFFRFFIIEKIIYSKEQ